MEGGDGVPGTHRISVPHASSNCLFKSVGEALLENNITLADTDNHKWFTMVRGHCRLQLPQLLCLMAGHVLSERVSNEEFHKIMRGRVQNKQDYANRLKEAGDRLGRQDWGTIEDLQIVAHWLDASSNFTGSIYTYVRGHRTLTRVTKTKRIIREPPSNVNDNDIVLYNSNNTHWMNTLVSAQQFPPLVDPNAGVPDEEPEVIEID